VRRSVEDLAAVIGHLERQLRDLRAELQGGAGVASAAAEAEPSTDAAARAQARRRPLDLSPEAVHKRAIDRARQLRRQQELRAAGIPRPGRGPKRDPSVIQEVDHADHALQLDRARVVVDLDLDPETKNKKGNACAKRVIHDLDRPKVHEDFRAAAKALGVEYPERDQVPFWEKRACQMLLEEYKPEEIGRARDALARQKRSGDAFERRKPFTLAYLQRNVLELLQSNPKPARPRRQLAFADPAAESAAAGAWEAPQERIVPRWAPLRPPGPAAAPELVKDIFKTLEAKGLKR